MNNEQVGEIRCKYCGGKAEEHFDVCKECYEKKSIEKAKKNVKISYIVFWILIFVNFFVSFFCFYLAKELSDNPNKAFTLYDYFAVVWFDMLISIVPCVISYSDAKKINKKSVVITYRVVFAFMILFILFGAFIP